ncbi:MAG: hypothetical protein HC811_07515 [Flammeovirgaceae bacterium]|nr:hypothetical protein [Flammeovirgaceae bacterium]
MKTIFVTIIMICLATVGFAQDTTYQNATQYYIVLYTLGENWDTSKQPQEQLYFKEHSSHLSELRKSKRIDMGGRYSDTGMILLKAKDETEAQNLITKDIAIQNKLFNAAVFPFNPFYKGCVE